MSPSQRIANILKRANRAADIPGVARASTAGASATAARQANVASGFGEAALSKQRNGVRDPIRGLACLLAISACLLLWHHYGMNRALRLTAADHYTVWPYDDRDAGGKSIATVRKTPSAILLHCKLNAEYATPYCGFSVSLSESTRGVDLSRFSTIALDIDTPGTARLPVRGYLRNFDPRYARKGDPASLKVNQMQYVPREEPHPFVLPLEIFQVAQWWIASHDITPVDSMPDLRNITVLEVATGDFAMAGDYTVSVASIAFQGKWISLLQLLSAILALWSIAALLFVIGSIVGSRREVRTIRREKRELERVNAALELQRQELEAAATHDDLTGLYNRVGLRNSLYSLVLRAREKHGALSAIFVDVDHFKAVNDRYGHLVGDELLAELAAFLKGHTREGDGLCRWGGEEFVLLCADTPLHAAFNVAEKLRVLISRNRWSNKLDLTCSFGVAQMEPHEDIGSLFRRADAALYHAKQSGRNRVAYSTGAMIVALDRAA
jgi:diguanylate cyclase (GGDEF)-like protein